MSVQEQDRIVESLAGWLAPLLRERQIHARPVGLGRLVIHSRPWRQVLNYVGLQVRQQRLQVQIKCGFELALVKQYEFELCDPQLQQRLLDCLTIAHANQWGKCEHLVR